MAFILCSFNKIKEKEKKKKKDKKIESLKKVKDKNVVDTLGDCDRPTGHQPWRCGCEPGDSLNVTGEGRRL